MFFGGSPPPPAALCPDAKLELYNVFMFAACWEVLYQILKVVCKSSPHEKIRSMGASYIVAFCNALMCSVGGTWVVASLYAGDFQGRIIVVDPQPSMYWPYLPAGPVVYDWLATAFLGWLMYDVVHIFLFFPKLGGADTVAHHLGFICLTLLGSCYKVIPFAVGWLLVGEISSLPLNIRWALISTGRGATKALDYTNYSFALSFFVVRVILYWSGVYHLLMYLRPGLVKMPYSCYGPAVNTIVGFITAGALLNAHWMIAIVKMATRGEKKKK